MSRAKKAQIDEESFKDRVLQDIAQRLTVIGGAIVEDARKRAPVGTVDKKGELIRLKPSFVPPSGAGRLGVAQAKFSEARGNRERVRTFREFVAGRPRFQSEKESRRELAQLFKFHGKGVVHEVIETPRGLRGLRESGRLRDSIAFEGPFIEGTRVTGRVVARVPYAMAIELGWHGKTPTGGNATGKAQPYLLPAVDAHRKELENIGKG